MHLLSSVTEFHREQTRTISPENKSGEKGRSCMAASALGPARKGSGFIRLPAGESITLAEINGPAEIRHMWFTLTDKTHRGSFVLRDVILRIYWDDETTPSVESPIGDFFCNGFGARCEINSLPIVVNPTGGFNSYFRMPFNRSAKIVICNEHEVDIEHFFFTINYALVNKPFNQPLYFHAQWRRQRVTHPGKDYVVLDNIQGHGYYVGTYLALTALERYWWGEGEFKFYVDGDSEYPTQHSTGTEDYFGGAWAFHHRDAQGRASAQCFQTLFVGYPWQTKRDHTRDFFQTGDANPVHGFGDDALPMHGLYRWHLPDPISFHENIRVAFQQIGNDDIRLYERSDDIATVAYWYQNPGEKHYPPFPNQQQRLPR